MNAAAAIRLSARALEAIAAHAAASSDGRETGGILLGYEESSLGAMLVMEAGDSGPNAERRPDFFRRDVAHAQQLADEALERSGSRWIGEWHTHPNGALAPSRTDLRTYRSFLRDPELGFGSFLAVIVGPGEEGWSRPRAAAWLIELRRILPALLLPRIGRLELTVESPADRPEERKTR